MDATRAPLEVDRSGEGERGLAVGVGVVLVVLLCLVRFGPGGRGLVAAFLAGVLVVLAVVDLQRRVIPNRIVLPATAIVLAAQLALFPERALEWTLAGVGAALFFLVAGLAYPGGLGMGDVKLALLLGAGLGNVVVAALTVGLLLAGAAGLVLLARDGGAARKQAIPLGPFLALGSLVALLGN